VETDGTPDPIAGVDLGENGSVIPRPKGKPLWLVLETGIALRLLVNQQTLAERVTARTPCETQGVADAGRPSAERMD
jgi:hypothetical protein